MSARTHPALASNLSTVIDRNGDAPSPTTVNLQANVGLGDLIVREVMTTSARAPRPRSGDEVFTDRSRPPSFPPEMPAVSADPAIGEPTDLGAPSRPVTSEPAWLTGPAPTPVSSVLTACHPGLHRGVVA